MSTALSEAQNKASDAGKNIEALESQLSEANALLEEETRQKLALNSKLRNLKQANLVMTEQLEEEEESKRQLEKTLADVRTQLSDVKRKADEEGELVSRFEDTKKRNVKAASEITKAGAMIITSIIYYKDYA